MDIVLETDRLGKRYGRTWALQECSLHLPAGRVAALVGPNGAGKSTLLHLAVGLLSPDAGTVRVFDSAPYDNTTVLASSAFHHTVPSASYPVDSERRSRSPSPWRSGRGCCCLTSRSPGWIRSRGESSCSP